MIRSYCKIALLVLVLFFTAFIFSNSLKNSQESHKDSNVIVEIVEEVAEKIKPDNQLDWNYIVRKGAHLFEFFVLGVFTTALFLRIKQKSRASVACTFIYMILIACTDEFIQLFTGRTSSITDVMIDMFGASVGIGLVLLLNWIFIRSRRNMDRVNMNC